MTQKQMYRNVSLSTFSMEPSYKLCGSSVTGTPHHFLKRNRTGAKGYTTHLHSMALIQNSLSTHLPSCFSRNKNSLWGESGVPVTELPLNFSLMVHSLLLRAASLVFCVQGDIWTGSSLFYVQSIRSPKDWSASCPWESIFPSMISEAVVFYSFTVCES